MGKQCFKKTKLWKYPGHGKPEPQENHLIQNKITIRQITERPNYRKTKLQKDQITERPNYRKTKLQKDQITVRPGFCKIKLVLDQFPVRQSYQTFQKDELMLCSSCYVFGTRHYRTLSFRVYFCILYFFATCLCLCLFVCLFLCTFFWLPQIAILAFRLLK